MVFIRHILTNKNAFDSIIIYKKNCNFWGEIGIMRDFWRDG